MDDKDIRKFLKGHFYATQKIKVLEAEGRELQDDDPIKAENEKEIEELKNQQTVVRNAIASLHDNDLESVLRCRYILHLTEEQTAEFLNYACRTIQEKTKKAIKKLKTGVEMC